MSTASRTTASDVSWLDEAVKQRSTKGNAGRKDGLQPAASGRTMARPWRRQTQKAPPSRSRAGQWRHGAGAVRAHLPRPAPASFAADSAARPPESAGCWSPETSYRTLGEPTSSRILDPADRPPIIDRAHRVRPGVPLRDVLPTSAAGDVVNVPDRATNRRCDRLASDACTEHLARLSDESFGQEGATNA